MVSARRGEERGGHNRNPKHRDEDANPRKPEHAKPQILENLRTWNQRNASTTGHENRNTKEASSLRALVACFGAFVTVAAFVPHRCAVTRWSPLCSYRHPGSRSTVRRLRSSAAG